MNSRQTRQGQSIKNVVNLPNFAPMKDPEFASNMAELVEIKARIDALSFVQGSQHPSADSGRIERLRTELRVKYLLRISRRARVLLSGVGGIKQDFKVPHARKSTKELIESARRIITNYRRYDEHFIAAGFAKNFAKKADEVIAELEKWWGNTDTAMNRRSRATGSLPKELARGREIIDSMDSAVTAEYSDDTVVMSVWRSAKRVPARKGRPKKRRKPPNSD